MLNPESGLRSPWVVDVKPFCIVDNVYYVGNKENAAHLIDTGDGLLLIDTPYASQGYLLLESIRELGFDPHDIRWIVHSHGHIDHFGATRLLVEKFRCRTYFPAVDMPLLNERKELNWCDELGLPFEPPYDTWFAPDVLMHPNDTFAFGNTTLTVYDAAGHTPGTMALFLSLPCGLTAAMHGGIGRNTLSAAYSHKYGLGDSWRVAYLRSMQALRDLKVDVVLGNHPYQADVFGKLERRTLADNPFIDVNEWTQMVGRCIEKFHAMTQRDPL